MLVGVLADVLASGGTHPFAPDRRRSLSEYGTANRQGNRFLGREGERFRLLLAFTASVG